MTLAELKKVKDALIYKLPDHDAIAIINREIRLKTIDPRDNDGNDELMERRKNANKSR